MKKFKNYYSFFFILLLFCKSLYSADSIFYISPGIGASWDFRSNALFNWKLSFGIMIDSEREYYNITVGGRSFINKQKKSWELKYYYFESQMGSFFKPDPLSGGLGFGFAYFPHQCRYCPKLSSFAGAGLFLGFDYLFDHERTDLGIELVFPYPLEKKYRSIN